MSVRVLWSGWRCNVFSFKYRWCCREASEICGCHRSLFRVLISRREAAQDCLDSVEAAILAQKGSSCLTTKTLQFNHWDDHEVPNRTNFVLFDTSLAPPTSLADWTHLFGDRIYIYWEVVDGLVTLQGVSLLDNMWLRSLWVTNMVQGPLLNPSSGKKGKKRVKKGLTFILEDEEKWLAKTLDFPKNSGPPFPPTPPPRYWTDPLTI